MHRPRRLLKIALTWIKWKEGRERWLAVSSAWWRSWRSSALTRNRTVIHPLPLHALATKMTRMTSEARRSCVRVLVGGYAVMSTHELVRARGERGGAFLRFGRERGGRKRMEAAAVVWCCLNVALAWPVGKPVMYGRQMARVA
jgi:hypothetical protein